jgi:quercetin dioxygenase-like cupin family protein
MSQHEETALIEGSLIVTRNGEEKVADISWTPHPTFPGVFLKTLVSGADTDGALSCHLVRVEPGKCLSSHVHAGQWELHEVAAGEGVARIEGGQVAYCPGVTAVIPRGVAHEVTAGATGLRLFAKFFPALV